MEFVYTDGRKNTNKDQNIKENVFFLYLEKRRINNEMCWVWK